MGAIRPHMVQPIYAFMAEADLFSSVEADHEGCGRLKPAGGWNAAPYSLFFRLALS